MPSQQKKWEQMIQFRRQQKTIQTDWLAREQNHCIRKRSEEVIFKSMCCTLQYSRYRIQHNMRTVWSIEFMFNMWTVWACEQFCLNIITKEFFKLHVGRPGQWSCIRSFIHSRIVKIDGAAGVCFSPFKTITKVTLPQAFFFFIPYANISNTALPQALFVFFRLCKK